MSRGEGAGRPLAVDDDLLAAASADVVVLELGDVVGNVVDEVHAELFPGHAEHAGEDLAGLVVKANLAIAPQA